MNVLRTLAIASATLFPQLIISSDDFGGRLTDLQINKSAELKNPVLDGLPFYSHEEDPSDTHGKINVYLKQEERDKLKHGSLYELVGVNVEKGKALAVLPDDVKKAYPLDDDNNLFPKLGNKDKLNLRALNKEFRKKFLLVLHDYHLFDLTVDMSDALYKLNTTKYPYNNNHELVLDQLPLKDQRAQMACDLMKEGLLEVTGFYFKNQNKDGFRLLVNAVMHTPTVHFSGLDAGYTAELAKLLPKNSHIKGIGIGHGAKSKEDQRALKDIIRKSTGLKTLYLRDGNIDDEGASAIAEALENNVSVTHIDLCGNAITGRGAEALTTMLKPNRTLERLDLFANKLKVNDLEKIQKNLKENKTLKRIDVGGNNFYPNPSECGYEDAIKKVKGICEKDPRICR